MTKYRKCWVPAKRVPNPEQPKSIPILFMIDFAGQMKVNTGVYTACKKTVDQLLHSAYHPQPALVLLHGRAGCGKTALAIRVITSSPFEYVFLRQI